MDDFSKGQKDMLVVVFSQYVASLLEEPKGGFREDLSNIIDELIPENLDAAMDIVADAKNLTELKLMLTALNKTNELINTLQEDNGKLSSKIKAIEMKTLERDGKFNSKEWRKLRKKLADGTSCLGAFIYEIILNQSTEDSKEMDRILYAKPDEKEEYLEILELNGIVGAEDKDGEREVFIPHIFNLEIGENRIKLYSSLTNNYQKSVLLRNYDLLRLTTTQVESKINQLVKEGWYQSGKEFAKNNDEWWEEWKLEHWVAKALSVTQ